MNIDRCIDQKCCIGVIDIDRECEYNINNYLDKACNNTVPFYKIDMRADKGYIRYTVYRKRFNGRSSMSLASHRIFDMSLKADNLATLELMYECQFGGPFNNHGIKQIDDII
jgi:hypothetical protein